MRICPKCRAFYGDPQLAFCLADGTPLANVAPQSDKFNEASRVIEEQAKRLSKRSRRLRWRKIALASMTTLVMTMVVTTSFTVETTPPSQTESPSSLPSPDPPSLTPTESPSPSISPSSSPSPSPSPSRSISPTPTPVPVYKIAGVVTTSGQPLGGIDVQLSGAKADSTKTDPNGRYAFNDLPAGGNYIATPRHVQIIFAPASRSFNSLSKDELADFPADVFKISGLVTQNGRPLSRVKISLQGSKAAAEFTNNDGYYSFSNLRAGGGYVVIPRGQETEPAQKFDLPRAGFENLRRDESADFKLRVEAPPPPTCNEGEMIAEAMEVSQAWHLRFREMIQKYEHAADIPDTYIDGVKRANFGWGPLQRKDIRFLEPCKVFVVNIQYGRRLPANPEAHRESEVILKFKDFTCEKRRDGWNCH